MINTDTDDIHYKNHNLLVKRIAKLENFQDIECNEFRKRIEKLESKIHEVIKSAISISDCHRSDRVELYKRIDKIEQKLNNLDFLSDLINRAIEVFQDNDGLKPHKCPVCDGYCRVLTEAAKVDFDGMLRANLPTGKDCKACEGKGIIWG